MIEEEIFVPDVDGSIGATATTTAATVALPAKGEGKSMLVTNDGAVAVLVKFGANASLVAVTDTTGMPILPGTQVPLRAKRGYTHASIKTRSGTSTIVFTIGSGS